MSDWRPNRDTATNHGRKGPLNQNGKQHQCCQDLSARLSKLYREAQAIAANVEGPGADSMRQGARGVMSEIRYALDLTEAAARARSSGDRRRDGDSACGLCGGRR